MMSCFDFSVVTTCEKGSGVSFLDKTMKKELYGLGYGHTKHAKICMDKSTSFSLREHKARKNHYFSLIS